MRILLNGGVNPSKHWNVSVPLFVNQTPEFELSEKLTNVIIEQISEQNIIKIVSNPDSDSVINGEIVSVSDGPYAFIIMSKLVNIVFQLKLKPYGLMLAMTKNYLKKTSLHLELIALIATLLLME